MSTSEAFLSDIIEHPDDDAPRLIYADWLDDNDDPTRAEFIRVQCALAAAEPDAPGREALEARERELLGKHWQRWLAPLPAWVRARKMSFQRGFIWHLEMTAAQLLRQAAGVFRRAPVVSVRLENLAGRLAEVVACPHLARLRRLGLAVPSREPDVPGQLARAAGLANLRALQAHGARLRASGLSELLASPHLTRLEMLQLRGSKVGNRVSLTLRARFGEQAVG